MTTVFSVVTPVYNGAGFIGHCYKSLAAQTFPDWEWIVVDDGSCDGTRTVVEGIGDPRIKLLSYEENRGRGYARSRALEAASGEWMVVWDADDLYFSDRLQSIAEARSEGYDFFCSYVVVVDNDMRIKGVRGFSLPVERGLTQAFVHHTLGVRMDLARTIGYDSAHRAGEDASMILTLAACYNGCFHPDALTVYREEQEIELEKAIVSNRHQLEQVRDAYRRHVVAVPRLKRWTQLGRWQLKLAALEAMRLVPALYRQTIAWRSYGALEEGWQLSSTRRVAFDSLVVRSGDAGAGKPPLDVP